MRTADTGFMKQMENITGQEIYSLWDINNVYILIER